MSYQLPPFTQWEKDWVKIGFLVFLKNIMLKQLRILPKWLLDVKFNLGLCFELPRSLEAAEAIRGQGQIWHPEVRASHLSIIYGGLGGSRSLEQPQAASDLKSGRIELELFGTSKNDTPPKVSVHHGMKKYMNEICLPCLLTELWLFVYILWQCKK